MPKISLDNLERYDGHLKDWCDARFAERKVHENWHEAGPSSAVSFYPVPDRPINPVINFAFTETLPSGDKGPYNPSTIAGVSSITVTRCETVGVNSTDYTIALGDTYYGGSVDLSTGIMTVTWGSYIVNGQEEWSKHEQSNSSCSGFYCTYLLPSTASSDSNNETRLVSHFSSFSPNMVVNTFFVGGGSNGKRVVLKYNTESFPDLNTFTSWLAQQYANGTPVTIAYKLATPYAVQLTPTQIYSLSQSDLYTPRINTVYSDQQNVLVRYPKSPIVTGSELDNAILSLGGD